ncbi:MAG: hypothetical protein WCX65_11180 [bacterium]
MKLNWVIENKDIVKVKKFYDQHKDNDVVSQRTIRNLREQTPAFSKNAFWKSMISCLLTTQQKSGPGKPVNNFINETPFPLDYDLCKQKKHLNIFVNKTLSIYGGIRRGNSIGNEASSNYEWLETSGWPIVRKLYKELSGADSKQKEREAANVIIDNMKGFGPKQSRNLLQDLGLTKYEIPVDSRITKWLNDFGFPIKLTATALSDRNYYNFVLDGFQELCERCDIYPCLMDAAIFSSFDKK